MAPKNKGKKGKKGDDDFWDKAGEAVAPNTLTTAPVEDVDDIPGLKSGFSGYAALTIADEGGAQPEEDEEDFGGLMSALKATAAKGKKDKKKPKKNVVEDVANGSALGEGSDAEDAPASTSKGPIQVTAEDLADEEWGPVKEKKKKDKKKGKKGKAQDDEDEKKEDEKAEEEKSTPAPAESATLPKDDGASDAEEAGAKILSKKEKEKLKKEREKAKKKAQAAAKKAEEAPEQITPPATTDIPAATKDEGEEEGEEGAGSKADSKKKKKKKGKKDDEVAPAPTTAPAAAAGKKKGGLSALKALMEEKKRLEEEAKRQLEEEQRRIDEEERKLEEEERKKEEERQRRKEKEKAKKEIAKKEGRLLTKKQREEKQMAEIRKQALLASGVQIEGLQQASGSAPTPKKVVYGNRKKKGPTAKDASPAPESRPRSPESVAAPPPPPAKEASPAAEDEAKDDWEATSEEEANVPPAPEAVKDDWDASSEDEEKAPAPAKTKPAVPIQPQPKGQPAQKPAASKAHPTPKAATPKTPAAPKAAPSKAAPLKAAPPPKDESSEESSEEEDEGSSEETSEEESEEEESSDEELTQTQKMAAQKKVEAAERRAKVHEAALAARSKDNLRSPICCILGHVDTGKTKLLDKIRQTNVQEGEAGGITQQIGATYFPVDAIKTKTQVLNKDGTQEYKIPGLLVIDTPGHESFTNLRSRGSSLCNIAILVVDIMHGLEAQTLESLRLLRDRKTPFIVALNKIDRIYSWDPTPDGAFRESLAKQSKSVQREFEDRVAKTILAFAEEGLNACLYYDNKNFARNVSLVPTSAITGEGIPDMIMLLVNLTQQRMSDRLMYLSELECTVLEVKVIEGLGTTIDVVLSNGILREGDKIVVCGLNGPIVTQIRALLTPQPLRELRIKSAYVHHKEVKAALGVKITAPDLEKTIAGSRLLVVGPDDDEDDLREEIMSDLTSLLNSIDKSGRGVCVQASTLGSLEALLDFLKSSKIPVSGINIGPVHKKDIMRAATMLEKAKELACILCFDVTIDKEAERLAEEMGIRLFKADIIYHLFDAFKAYNEEITEAKRKDAAPQAVWPCRLKIIAAFCKRDPIILGVDILDGTLRVGTPLAVVKTDPVTGKKDIIPLGKITSLEINHKTFDIVKKSQAGAGVAIKIEHAVYQSSKMFGRHFDEKDELLSHISRQSIDVLKESFKADVSMDEWHLIKALKQRFGIP
ncbi:Eukaryotic translation initiation factor 5B [Hypsizygus marmoreus]|uniref:Eukaryotic translation initiation factor 5B n=1 Tax=Hypsizygus marmoreus TaxID=39966 RepID=A0A369J0I9_HYPMA|nr:Eukaryotic translation initiation factor 5B [Hypsizygus marmoreus]